MRMLNLAYFLTRTARQHPDWPAVIHGDTLRDYAWLDRRVGALAGALRGLGLAPGDRVGIVTDLEPRSLECLWAPPRAGLVMVPMNPKLHPAEHAFMLRDAGAKALIVGAERRDALLAVRDTCPELRHVIAMDSAGIDGVIDYDGAIAAAPAMEDAAIDDHDAAWLFYTSGTTGHPKGAIHTHRSLRSMADIHLIDVFPTAPGDRLAHLTPMSHAAGLMALHQTAAGGAHVFPTFKSFQPEDFYRFVARHRVTKATLVPTMIQRLLDAPWPPPCDISSLQTVLYGAAPMYVDRLKEALARFGAIFVQVYAQGEAPLSCTRLSKAEHVAGDPRTERRLASAGRACHAVEVAVVDGDDRPVKPGMPGEIVARGDVVMQGYWNNPAATAETLRNGWLHTGDIGHLDEDGFLYITDRVKDMIIKGGTNIYPREVEEVLHRHPAIREATVFGIPDPGWGEQVIAAVSLNDGMAADDADLGAWCLQHLASFKKPLRFHVIADLPKNGYGKILKREIRAQLYPAAKPWAGGVAASA